MNLPIKETRDQETTNGYSRLIVNHLQRTGTAKIITGSDGQYIPNLKLWLLENRNVNNKEIFEKAKELFGTSSLILQLSPTNFMADQSIFDDANETIFKPGSLYQSKFNDPFFNPRWIYGSADYTEVLER